MKETYFLMKLSNDFWATLALREKCFDVIEDTFFVV